MDGLLVSTEPLWKLAEIKVFGSVGIDLTEQGCAETVGLRIDEVVDIWYRRHPWDNKTKEKVVQEIIEEMIHLIDTKATLMPGVEHAIKLGVLHKMKMAIASSSYQVLIDKVIEKFGFDMFEFGYSAEFEKYGKPHPGVFMTAAKKLGVSFLDTVVFEDSINGVISAKAARMKAIAVPDYEFQRADGYSVADVILPSLELLEEKHLL